MTACSDDDEPDNPDGTDGNSVFALGLGVSTSAFDANWYVLDTDDIMTGTVSVIGNGELQDGYRDFTFGGNTFYSIGGLNGVTDVVNYTLNAENKLTSTNDQTFPLQLDDLKDVTGTGENMLGISQPPKSSTRFKYYLL